VASRFAATVRGVMGRVFSTEVGRVRRLAAGPLGRLAAIAGCLLLANCSATDKLGSRIDPKYGVSSSPRVVAFGQPVPKGGGTYRVGKPYQVAGRTYVPRENPNYRSDGIASWYGRDFHGRLTANGEVYDMNSLSAAHPTLPIPSYARVTNLSNGRSVIVRVNDRGPFHANREIDLSVRTAHVLGFHDRGLARVRVEYVGRAPLEGSDDRVLLATLREGGPAPHPSKVMVASTKPVGLPRLASRASGPVPVPEGRPYSLGRESGASTTAGLRRGSVDITAAARKSLAAAERREARRSIMDPRPTSTQSAFAESPVAAYAPTTTGAVSGYTSGRGLY